MLQNARVRAFTVSELLRENQQEGGGKITPSPRLGLSANPMVNHAQWLNKLKQFIGCCRRIAWVWLTILGGLALKELIFID